MAPSIDAQSEALIALGRLLQRAGYAFTAVTPATHERLLARSRQRGKTQAAGLRDVFGWSLPFSPALLPAELMDCMQRAAVLEPAGDLLRARVRFSTLGQRLFVHSAFPTSAEDAVFFGPDTYRFCAFVLRSVRAARRIVDVGCGSGAGGISLGALQPERLVLADINARALALARVNAALAGAHAEVLHSDVLQAVTGELDLIIANPPYMHDAAARTYRHGGGTYGEALSVRIVAECLPRLAAGGTLCLYTGAPVVEGQDMFAAGIRPVLQELARDLALEARYEELDPDVFGEELMQPRYEGVERIAAVGLTVRVSGR